MSAVGMRIFWRIFFGPLSHRIIILKTEMIVEISIASWPLASASVLISLATVTNCHRLSSFKWNTFITHKFVGQKPLGSLRSNDATIKVYSLFMSRESGGNLLWGSFQLCRIQSLTSEAPVSLLFDVQGTHCAPGTLSHGRLHLHGQQCC